MPNNENDFFELPKENSENTNPNPAPENKNIIEIPQEFYDKVTKEEQEKAAEEAKKQAELLEQQAASSESQGLLLLSFINAIIIFGLLYGTVNISMWLFLCIPVVISAFSLFIGLKDREKSVYPSSVLVGGIICAVISFVISMVEEESADLYMYYSLFTAGIGFLGYAVSYIITKYTYDAKNIKALQTIGYLLFFAALIGVPYYIFSKYPEEFFKIFTRHQVEVRAETEEEFVRKTMKARYNIDYTCEKTKNYINEHNRKQLVRTGCKDNKGNQFTITSIAYNEGSNQYVVTDTYLDSILISKVKHNLEEELKSVTFTKNIVVSLYPEENCFFYGDCVDCDEYYARYEKENNIESQYKISSSINFEKYLTSEPKKFINDEKFKYIINVYGSSYNDTNYTEPIDAILKELNTGGYKNNYGFVINLYNVIGESSGEGFQRLAYKVVGDTNNSKTFEEYKRAEVSAPTK